MNQTLAITKNSHIPSTITHISHNGYPLRLIGQQPKNAKNGNGRKIKYHLDSEARSDFDVIKSFSTVRKLDKNEMLINEGDDAIHFYEILFGDVKTYTILSDGRRQITNFLRKGDVIGLPQEKNHSFSAQAITRTDVRRYSFTEMNDMMQKSPFFANKVLTIIQKELTNARNQIVLLGCKTPDEKVATFLLNCEYSPTGQVDYETLIYLPMSLIDIADHLGMAQETICRVLAKYKRSGMLKFQSLRKRREIYVNSMISLNRVAELEEH